MKTKKVVKIILIVATVCITPYLVLFLSSAIYREIAKQDDSWKRDTSPLSMEVVNDICTQLEIETSPECTRNNDVYAPDFFDTIDKIFDKKETTYQFVQEKIGRYQTELESLSYRSDGTTYFVSRYDLRGDGATAIVFFFFGDYQSNSLMKIKYIYSSQPGF